MTWAHAEEGGDLPADAAVPVGTGGLPKASAKEGRIASHTLGIKLGPGE
jgi:hypothetical protein